MGNMLNNEMNGENLDNVILPGQHLEYSTEQYKSPEIEGSIEKKRISTVVVGESTEVKYPSYLIDLSKIGEMSPCVMSALRGLLKEDGDTVLYIKLASGIIEIGNADATKLYSILELYIEKLFKGVCKVYKNTNGTFKLNKIYDVSGLRLEL